MFNDQRDLDNKILNRSEHSMWHRHTILSLYAENLKYIQIDKNWLGNLNTRRYLFLNIYFIFYWGKICVVLGFLIHVWIKQKQTRKCEKKKQNKTENGNNYLRWGTFDSLLYRYVRSGCFVWIKKRVCLKNVTMFFIASQFWEDHILSNLNDLIFTL